MKYLIGETRLLIDDEYKTRYSNCKFIEAESMEEGIQKYILMYPMPKIFVSCVGIVDEKDRLIITDYVSKYTSGKALAPTSCGNFYHLVSKLIDEPPMLSLYCLYLPVFVPATSEDSAIAAYESNVKTKRFPTYYIGYLDENGTFIIPNISRFIC